MPIGIRDLTEVMQTCLAPVALVSGIGLLLLSMTNRLSRTIDRTRALSGELGSADENKARQLSLQIAILYQRSEILRISITLAAVSVFFVSVIVLCVFAMYLLSAPFYKVIMGLWGLAILALVLSVAFFIHDVTLTLRALNLEVRTVIGPPKQVRKGLRWLWKT
jgi:hypothetical protein